MKAVVDSDRCRGHGICVAICPEAFTLNDDGYAEASPDAIPSDLAEAVDDAAGNCPEQAITVDPGLSRTDARFAASIRITVHAMTVNGKTGVRR